MPGSASAVAAPPCASATAATIEIPSPEPPLSIDGSSSTTSMDGAAKAALIAAP
ncbi:MAG: hypothetical protein ABR583_14550 [Gaiellaceae bacterium]